MNDRRIREIIREEVDALDFFGGINQRSGGLTPWDSEGKMGRMQPINASRSNGSVPTKDIGVIRGYNDWSKNFRDAMTYPQYCEKFGLRR
jgi:hypothetical protein